MNIINAFLFFLLASFQLNATAQTSISVNLDEWRITSNKTHIPSGNVTFAVKNLGQDTHELVILKTHLTHDAIPLAESGGIDEKNAGTLVDEIEGIEPASTKTMSVNLTPGNYVLLCNIVEVENGELEKHYDRGMRVALIVE